MTKSPSNRQASRRSVASWVTYDLANTIFALGVGSLYFPTWMNEVGGSDTNLAVALNVAMAVVIILAPWVGALGDFSGKRVRLLIPTTLLAVTATFFLGSFGLYPSLALFTVAVIGFNLGGVPYNALLPDVSSPQTRGRVSGLGVGVGYFGSALALIIGAVLLDSYGYPAVFKAIAIAFLLFALPSFIWIEERPRLHTETGDRPRVRSIPRHFVQAWQRARAYPQVARFLVGRFLYTDAINTIIGGFLAIYAKEDLGMTDAEIRSLLGISVVFSIAGGIGGGRLVDRYGPRRVLHGTLYLWIFTIAVAVTAGIAGLVSLAPLIGIGAGIALGLTWSSDRVYMTAIAPPQHLGEFYGLYAMVGRFATLLGPLVWAIQVDGFGWPRAAALGSLTLFIIAARIVLNGVDDGFTSPASTESPA
ncbi:MAG: MFS transporter [Acidobacteria bacterium]|nr:MFS transporter [Acidobacteriota bacterium]MCH8985336.1 MFS transporter [Acidobacteriota bacterium]